MLALFHAMKQCFDTYTPWGSLTGIRPSKMVRQWLDEGLTHENIINSMTDIYCCDKKKANLALQVALAEIEIAKKIQGTGVYISIPFCPSRCIYCSFNMSNKLPSIDMQRQYITCLIQEINKTQAKNISSIYIGGGTPTVLTDHELYRLLENICKHFNNLTEFTIEAGRPDTLTHTKLKILKEHGITRIAINPQTMNNLTLKSIGRNHTAEDFITAFEMARQYNFNTINSDIIIGLPGETILDVKNTVKRLLLLGPENITVHTLAVKRASKIHEQLSNFTFEHAKDIEKKLDLSYELITASNQSPYYLYRQKNMVGLFENTGFSKPGHECLYNIGMMAEVQTIIGYGAGAVSKFIDGDKITRKFNPKSLDHYILAWQ